MGVSVVAHQDIRWRQRLQSYKDDSALLSPALREIRDRYLPALEALRQYLQEQTP